MSMAGDYKGRRRSRVSLGGSQAAETAKPKTLPTYGGLRTLVTLLETGFVPMLRLHFVQENSCPKSCSICCAQS